MQLTQIEAEWVVAHALVALGASTPEELVETTQLNFCEFNPKKTFHCDEAYRNGGRIHNGDDPAQGRDLVARFSRHESTPSWLASQLAEMGYMEES